MDDAAGARGSGTAIYFEQLPDRSGLRITDPIERRQFDIYTETLVSPATSNTDQFIAPVDAATSIRAKKLTYPTIVAMYVRDERGSLVLEAGHEVREELSAGTYVVELEPPIKVYLKVDGPMSVYTEGEQTSIEFATETTVEIGARSRHTRPAATITTTKEPRDIMQTIPILSSALKTTSPERSYPTLRGHPPLVELGPSLDIPPGLSKPETGVTIELPTHLERLFEAAPLIYYLGADVRASDDPRIVTESGFSYDLASSSPFRGNIARVLKQVFLLDCVTRTEGIYEVALHERRELSADFDLDFVSLYDRSLADRLEAYLDIPFESIADIVPSWKLTTYVPPEPDTIKIIPYALDELSLVDATEREGLTSDTSHGTNGFREEAARVGNLSFPVGEERGYERALPNVDTLGHAWFRDGTALGTTKASMAAYRNRLEKTPTSGDISIAVVQNGPRMEDERDAVESIYGPRKSLPFEVQFYDDLDTDELRELFAHELDFLHYIGHVEDRGFECADGTLDAETLESVGFDSFFINACRSYEQGMGLIERGAIGGVVTLHDIVNTEAVELGRTLAKLLHLGFPLRPAIDLAKGESLIGDQYVVVGNGEASVAQPESGTVFFVQFERRDGKYGMWVTTYPTVQKGMGSMVQPTVGDEYVHYLNGGTIGPILLEESEVATFLDRQETPVLVGGEIHWSTDLDPRDVF